MTSSQDPSPGKETAPFGAYAPSAWRASVIAFTRSRPDTWFGRRSAFAARRLAFVANDEPLDVEIDTVRFRLIREGNLCEKRLMFTPQYFDHDELAAVRQHVRSWTSGPYIFLDIGSNIGAYALFIASWAKSDARIYAFEPQPHIHERLKANLAFNPFSTVSPQPIALADSDGEMTLFIDQHNSGESTLKQLDGHVTTSSVTVPAMTLLSFASAQDLPHISAMKLDVEGAEDLILSPFFANAPDELLPALIIVENADQRWDKDIVAEAKQRGYRIADTTRMNLILRR